jgi:hypothetical protein
METRMKIKIVKKATQVRPTGMCASFVDDPPMNKK